MDTCKLLVSLPFPKLKASDREIKQVLERSSISHEGLKSIIGKLENVILIVKMGGSLHEPSVRPGDENRRQESQFLNQCGN